MCIVFVHLCSGIPDNDYKLIVISNRDEFYKRPARRMTIWSEDSDIYGGRDLQPGCEGGTWLAVSKSTMKIGLLLNLPSAPKYNAKSRGKIVENLVKCNLHTSKYVESMREYFHMCNEFVLVSIEFGNSIPIVNTYNNTTNELKRWEEEYLGFGNSLPEDPLTKVTAGKCKLQEICSKFKKTSDKEKLIEALFTVLKSEERNLPDPQLKQRRPELYEQLSSIFVNIPEAGYGTRAHTILLVSKKGNVDLVEISMRTPIDPSMPCWERSDFKFDL